MFLCSYTLHVEDIENRLFNFKQNCRTIDKFYTTKEFYMNAKITLYSEKSLIDGMKEYAKMQNTSVSKLVTEFFTNTLKKKSVEKKSTLMQLEGILHDTFKSNEEAIEYYHKCLDEKYS